MGLMSMLTKRGASSGRGQPQEDAHPAGSADADAQAAALRDLQGEPGDVHAAMQDAFRPAPLVPPTPAPAPAQEDDPQAQLRAAFRPGTPIRRY